MLKRFKLNFLHYLTKIIWWFREKDVSLQRDLEIKDYRFCGGGLYIHTKFVGQYAKVDFIDVNGKPVKSI